jgi:hypothetical protein
MLPTINLLDFIMRIGVHLRNYARQAVSLMPNPLGVMDGV